MALPPNTIHTLSRIAVKPRAWHVIEGVDGTFSMRATYVDPGRAEFFEVTTARGQVKQYRSLAALMSDIRKVDLQPVVTFTLNG
jgi:hypothetical protein